MKKLLLLPLLFLASCSISAAQEMIRVCTYNVLNYSKANEDGRSVKFERILREIRPDILVAQEIVDESSAIALADAFLNGLQIHQVGFSGFNNGEDTDNMIYYNPDKLSIAAEPIYHTTLLRDIAEYTLEVISTGDTLHIFSVHLKAGDTQFDREHRVFEAEVLREAAIPSWNSNIIMAGAFNFYSANEPAYKYLTASTPIRDPIGYWIGGYLQYVQTFTQSPRMVADADCGGGTGGGVDHRFDLILHSEALSDNIITSSYKVFGNDGMDRRNSPINDPPNTKVSATIADDLACASDHLPVYADFVFNKPTAINENESLQEISFKETSGTISVSLPLNGTVTIIDILGRPVVKESVSGQWNLQRNSLQNGVYFIQVQSDVISKGLKFVVAE